MAKFGKQELWQAISCVLCIAVAWVHSDDVGASEFSGGRVTGPLFAMADNGSLLFIPALVLPFFYRRIAAVVRLLASILCLPLYLHFTAPPPSRSLLRAGPLCGMPPPVRGRTGCSGPCPSRAFPDRDASPRP